MTTEQFNEMMDELSKYYFGNIELVDGEYHFYDKEIELNNYLLIADIHIKGIYDNTPATYDTPKFSDLIKKCVNVLDITVLDRKDDYNKLTITDNQYYQLKERIAELAEKI